MLVKFKFEEEVIAKRSIEQSETGDFLPPGVNFNPGGGPLAKGIWNNLILCCDWGMFCSTYFENGKI